MKAIKRCVAGVLAVVAVAVLATSQASYAAASPDGGVGIYNASLCGSNDWVRVKLPESEFTVHDSAGTCIAAMRHRLDFRVVSNNGPAWNYPNISSGYEQGDSSCASGKDTCYGYPVQEKNDGTPTASVGAWLAPGTYNLAFDIWFSPTKAARSYQNRTDDTEVMVWLRDPNIHQSCNYHVRIDGVKWCVRDGWAGGGSGKPWRRVTFDAQNGKLGKYSVSNLWLNPFFRNAEAHGMLSASEWLYAIDLGNELYSGGVGDNIHFYSLQGVK